VAVAGWQWQEIVGGGSAVILSGDKLEIHFFGWWQWRKLAIQKPYSLLNSFS
jgi:hypothetical protein